MASPLRLLREAGLMRYNLIVFAMLTAALNGLVTASVGAWLAHAYADHKARREAVQSIADLVYERRTRAGLVVSSLRRGAELDEVRQRKRAYDDIFVEWNKRIQTNLLQIRDVLGPRDAQGFEEVLEFNLVAVLAQMDGCLTKGFDARVAGQSPMTIVDGCQYPVLHQFVLDCAKVLTDELHRLTRLSFNPLSGSSRREIGISTAQARAACARPQLPPPTAAPAAPAAAVAPASAAPPPPTPEPGKASTGAAPSSSGSN